MPMTKKHGFSHLTTDEHRAMASRGGIAARDAGTAHRFSSREAVAAVKRLHALGLGHTFTSTTAKRAGTLGGQKRAAKCKEIFEAGKQAARAALPITACPYTSERSKYGYAGAWRRGWSAGCSRKN